MRPRPKPDGMPEHPERSDPSRAGVAEREDVDTDASSGPRRIGALTSNDAEADAKPKRVPNEKKEADSALASGPKPRPREWQ